MGHHGRRGSSFNAESIKKIVTRPVYIGYYSFKGHLYQGDYEPLISEKIGDTHNVSYRRYVAVGESISDSSSAVSE